MDGCGAQGIHCSTLMVNTVNHPDTRGMTIFADALIAPIPDNAVPVGSNPNP
jgi:hypothetical protein